MSTYHEGRGVATGWEWYRSQAKLIDKLDRLTEATAQRTAIAWYRAMRRSLDDHPIAAPGCHDEAYVAFLRQLSAIFNVHSQTIKRYRRVAAAIDGEPRLTELVAQYGSWGLLDEWLRNQAPDEARERRNGAVARHQGRTRQAARRQNELQAALVEAGASAADAEAILSSPARSIAHWLLAGWAADQRGAA